jgi:PAS domain S-box-containing protein
LEQYGFSEQELIGNDISIVRSSKNDSEINDQILNVTREKGWQGEIWNRKKDGTDFQISLSTSTVKNNHGEIIGMVGVAIDITEKKQVQMELMESEERYRSFFEGSPDAIFLADIETGTIIDANKAASDLIKKPVNEIIGSNQTSIHPPEEILHSKKVFKEDTERALKNSPNAIENYIYTSDGKKVPVEVLASLIHIKGKKVLQGVFRDISIRKTTEKALMESEKRYRQLVENQGEGVTIVDHSENLIYANPAAELIFGVEPGTLVHRNLREFIVLEQFGKVLKESQKRSERKKSTYEIEIQTPGGVKKQILVTATAQTNDEGHFSGTFGVIRDITDQKSAEESLRHSEQKYRNLIEIMPDGVYRSTPEGKFVDVNPAMVNILGYDSKEELMAIDIKTQLYFDPTDRESLTLKMNSEELDVFPLKKKDGSAVYIEDHGWWIKDEKGEVIFHEGISRDVTERKNAEMQLHRYSQELQELNATKDKFFSIIAHDLKSPFNSITGLSEMIKNEARFMDVGTIEKFAGVIHSTASNTYKLLENLLEWASIQQSNIAFQPEQVILQKIAEEIIELSIEKASRKKIKIINCIPEGLIISADKNMLKTIIRNLVSNALKFTQANGEVKIAAVKTDEQIEIQVIDNGVGISPENIEKLFKIGSNYSQRGTENEKGTGLGLLLCKEFVEKHNGKIWVESEEGKGTTFAFTIKQKTGT